MKSETGKTEYFLGLDVGSDAVGYAVTGGDYKLLKFRGEPVWGVHLFDLANPAEERRLFRSARRRIDRRQQRVLWAQEIFAKEIAAVDRDFYLRIKESALFPEDSKAGVHLFGSREADSAYNKRYPTIHHLICELMESESPHDVRLVYLGCAWLLSHRGHFLMDEISPDSVNTLTDISTVYGGLMSHFDELGVCRPWEPLDKTAFGNILKANGTKTEKFNQLLELTHPGKTAEDLKAISEEHPYSRECILKLLCGSKYALANLFGKSSYKELGSISLGELDEEKLAALLPALEENDGELISRMKRVYDWAVLGDILRGEKYISRAKVAEYEQHRADLRALKKLIRKYRSEKYNEVFREAGAKLPNYTAYSGNYNSCIESERKRTNQEAFCKYIKGILSGVTPDAGDEAMLGDIRSRLDKGTFMPKQVSADNRVIPYQVYYLELREILDRAAGYLPFLRKKDEDGYTPEEKLLAMMKFRIPYYVGPLRDGWLVRKADGPIRPWNFEDMVDEDATEAAFIRRLTGQCTYLPGEDVLPRQSMVYQRFLVLNEINVLRVGGERISVEAKQRLYRELFEKGKKATAKRVAAVLGVESVDGITDAVRAALSTHAAFRNLLASGALTENDVETIVARGTYSQDKGRFKKWLAGAYPRLPEPDIHYIAGQRFKDFGRLSRALLTETVGADKKTGEADTVLGWMWRRNVNLMELLSDKYTFAEQIAEASEEYYAGENMTLGERLDEMYVPSAAKRPVYRALDVIRDVVKAMGGAPKRLFIQTARGGTRDNTLPQSRYNRVKALYGKLKSAAAKALRAELAAMEPEQLQSDRVYLYFLQLGRCMYTGERIRLEDLNSRAYNLDHIWPRSKIRDDSVSNNLILVRSDVNRWKDDAYPIPESTRRDMAGFWAELRQQELITAEKYNRLTRETGFTPEEAWGFVYGQSVTRSAKVLATLLKEHYPDTEIVHVNGGLVNEFRREFDMERCTAVNDLYHAKDAYLNIVVGNVWHERFTRQWFFSDKRGDYTVRVGALFSHPVTVRGRQVWAGTPSVTAVGNTVRNKNAVHLTRYAYCRGGALFDQMPVPAKPGLVERKAGLPTEKYGGYTGLAVSYFLLVRYFKGKREILELVPVRTLAAEKVRGNEAAAIEYAQNCLGAKARDVTLPLGLRPLKINAVFDMDGYRVTLRGVSGPQVSVSPLAPLVIGYEWEKYVSRLERFVRRRGLPPADITSEKNLVLYDILCTKLGTRLFDKRPSNPFFILKSGRSMFEKLDVAEQACCLMQIILLFSRVITGCDLRSIGGSQRSAVSVLGVGLKNWPQASSVRVVDSSASGMFESRSRNLLDYIV